MSASPGKKSVFPYLVVATGIICCFGPCSFALSCAGIYFTPVSESLGVGRGAFALYLTIMLVVTALVLPVLGKLTETKDLRLVLSAGVACIGVPLIAMSFFNAVWQFYVTGAIMGIGLAEMLILTVPTLINRWFRKNVGFYIGLCMAFTALVVRCSTWWEAISSVRAPRVGEQGTLYLVCSACEGPAVHFVWRSQPSSRRGSFACGRCRSD